MAPTIDRTAQTPLAVQTAFQRVLAACAADASCTSAYPDLETTYRATLKQLDAQPLKIKGTVGGKLDSSMFLNLVLTAMYSPQTISEIPALIVAARDGNIEAITASTAAQHAAAFNRGGLKRTTPGVHGVEGE